MTKPDRNTVLIGLALGALLTLIYWGWWQS